MESPFRPITGPPIGGQGRAGRPVVLKAQAQELTEAAVAHLRVTLRLERSWRRMGRRLLVSPSWAPAKVVPVKAGVVEPVGLVVPTEAC